MFDKTISSDGGNGDLDGSFFLPQHQVPQALPSGLGQLQILGSRVRQVQDSYVGAILQTCNLSATQMARQGVLPGAAWSLAVKEVTNA